jgi:hypothetical protein
MRIVGLSTNATIEFVCLHTKTEGARDEIYVKPLEMLLPLSNEKL